MSRRVDLGCEVVGYFEKENYGWWGYIPLDGDSPFAGWYFFFTIDGFYDAQLTLAESEYHWFANDPPVKVVANYGKKKFPNKKVRNWYFKELLNKVPEEAPSKSGYQDPWVPVFPGPQPSLIGYTGPTGPIFQ
jgi:hypothetical protein